jgi:hypothetical protein
MPVFNNIQSIRRLTNSSLTSIIDVTNLNFKSLSEGLLEFLNKIEYNETLNSFKVSKGTFDYIDTTDLFRMTLDGIPTFSIDSLGRAEGQELLVKVAETKRLRLTDFNDWPQQGVPGEIIYTGIQNQRPEFGEDFIGFLQGRGWVSLTDGLGAGFITLSELTGSPPIPPCPPLNKGNLWIGSPGYETAYIPTSQTLYYTDENCEIFDLITDPIWEKQGNSAKFKLSDKVIIGDLTNLGKIQFIDGNQTPGYVLTSDANGNASWQPSSGGGGGGACSYVTTLNFIANTPATITHNLNTTNILVQLIDTVNNQLIFGSVNNYQLNTVEIELTQSLSNIKVVIVAVGCSGGGGGGSTCKGNKKIIEVGETLTICEDYQYMIYGNFRVEGILNNSGQLVIINGVLDLQPSGQINNIGTGVITIVNFATGDNIQVVVKNISGTFGNPILVNHGLGTKDFTYNLRDGNSVIQDNQFTLSTIDNDNFTITMTSSNLVSGVVTIHAKI